MQILLVGARISGARKAEDGVHAGDVLPSHLPDSKLVPARYRILCRSAVSCTGASPYNWIFASHTRTNHVLSSRAFRAIIQERILCRDTCDDGMTETRTRPTPSL